MLFRARPDQSRTVLLVILGLPIFWLLILTWGQAFFASSRAYPNPGWVIATAKAAPWLYALLGILCVWILPKARVLTAAYSLLNLYFVLVSTFIAAMAVTGVWL